MTDLRTGAGPKSAALFAEAQTLMPGGVNSPVRAFKSVGGTPRFMERGEGPFLFDVDGNRYIDYVLAWGPLLLGHGNSKIIAAIEEQARRGVVFGTPTAGEVELARMLVRLVPHMERVRLVSSGTEATMSALRLARAATGRDLFIKFDGCYHGHGDSFLVRAGSGAATLDVPDSPGVPAALAAMTCVARFNDLESVRAVFAAHPGQIAALFVEPVVGNYGVLPPRPGFLAGLRELCNANGALLVFDEVMTGFRVAPGGAQELYGVRADLVTLGKVIGGGMPIGAYGGSAELMERMAPSGPVYQAGTNSGNPVTVAAGIAALTEMERTGASGLAAAAAKQLAERLRELTRSLGIPATVNQVGSMWSLFFTAGPVDDLESIGRADKPLFNRFHSAMLARGVYLPPSAFESAFVSSAHTGREIEATMAAAGDALREIGKDAGR